MQFYPKARHQHHLSVHDPTIRSLRLGVLRAAAINLVILQLLFLALFCYIFGSLFKQSTHIHNLHILFVDYDGGAIGDAVRSAYQQLKGPGFPTLIEQPDVVYPEPPTIGNAVCNIEYWAALYITSDASTRLTDVFSGGSAASTYNSSDVLTLVWNEARYSTVVDSAIASNMQTLSDAARVTYSRTTGLQALQTLNTTDPAAVAAFSDPWTLTDVNIQPTTQGSRLIYNTLVIILIMIQEFFYLGYINGLYQQFRLYVSVNLRRISIVRFLISATYTFIGSLCTTGAIWAFRNGWNVNGGQFMLTWMALWLFAHLNFLVLDIFTIWLPPPYVPMALITWLVLNVTSILFPFELSPGFYRWGYALPAHNIFQVLIDIWSRGCNPTLDYSLPVLFVYELFGLTFSTVGVFRRAHYAVIAKETEEKTFQDRIAAAIGEQRPVEPAQDEPTSPEGEEEVGQLERRATALSEQEELGDRIWREMSKVERRQSSRRNTGPCFDLPFSEK